MIVDATAVSGLSGRGSHEGNSGDGGGNSY